MSTILDALKKSEQERKLANLPELSSMPLPEEEHDARLIWWGLGVLAILVLSIIAYLILNLSASSLNNEDGNDVPVVVAPTDQLPVNQYVESSYVVGSEVYSYNDLSGALRDVADSMNINVVSYTDDETKRFVMIDSHLYRIGNTVSLSDGAQVEVRDIEASAVVFRYQETQFRLSP